MRVAPRTLAAAGLIAATGIGCWLLWSPLGANDLVGGDEGYYGTTARNICADPRFLLSTPLSPLGPPGDKPPLYPGLLALSVRAFGPGEAALRWPSLLAAAALALAVAWLAGSACGAWGAVAGAALLISLPWFADASRAAAAEIPLTAFGAFALVSATSSVPSARRALGAGTLLGLAFLCKLWLVVLIGIPVASALWPPRGGRFAPLATLAAATAAVASLHLLAVVVLEPGLLPHWIRIYFERSLAERVGGEGYAPYWIKPPVYYWAIMTHAFGLLLPLVLLGGEAAWRRFREPVPRALLLWAAGVLLLSAFTVKSAPYLYVVVPAWAALAALGAHAIASGRRPAWPTVAFGLAASAPWLMVRLGASALPWPLWLGVWLLFLAGLALVRLRPGWAAAVAATLAASAIVPGLVREAQRLPLRYHAPGYRAVAAALGPRLADVPADRACFVSAEAPALSFYLFRTGRYWGTPITPWTARRRRQVESDTSLRAFVVDPRQDLYGGWPDSTTLRWLETSTTEITQQVGEAEGRAIALRVFVRP